LLTPSTTASIDRIEMLVHPSGQTHLPLDNRNNGGNVERKLDRMMEELRTTPTAIGYSVPPMPDAVSRLQLAHDEINKTFGVGFAEKHPEV
jgi:hypothetical protein